MGKLPTQHDDDKFNVQLGNVQELKSLFKGDKLEKLADAEASPVSIASQYFDFQLGKEQRFVFVGIVLRKSQDPEEAKKEDEIEASEVEAGSEESRLMPGVVLVDENGDTFINQGMLLVDAFVTNNVPKGTPVAVTWRGNKKTGNGFQVRTWSVKILSI